MTKMFCSRFAKSISCMLAVFKNTVLHAELSPFALYLSLGLILLTGCEKYYLSLRQVPVDANYLASVQANTPDPRRAHPPHGQKVVIQWVVPPELVDQKPQILFHVIYKNHTEKTFVYPIESRMGSKVYSLMDKEYEETGGLLTYRAEITTPDHHVYREWKHQLWVKLINLEPENSEEVP